ncbi:MAG: bifunctional precorrin-2 dehydrogenase/sirohydrochlorin ferrochelatase [Thermodesulfovibrionales bacterium]
MVYYPAFLNLKGRKTVVVGGGPVAERKVRSLLDAGALVMVISPDLTQKLHRLKQQGRIDHKAREFRAGDLKGCFLAIAATDDPDVNIRVAAEASCPVNVVDVPFLCSFIVPAVVKRGPLTLAISTGGASPALARTIRKELEKMYGREMAAYLTYVRHVRKNALLKISDRKKRESFLKKLAAPALLVKLRKEGIAAVRTAVQKELNSLTS